MAIIRCDKGHYYDNTKFSQCPQCGVLPILQEEKQIEKQEEKPHRFSFFRKEARKRLDDDKTVALETEDDDVTIALSEDDNDKTIALEQEDDDVTVALSEEDDDVTISLESDDDDKTIALEYDDDVTIALSEDNDDKTIALDPENDKDVMEVIEKKQEDNNSGLELQRTEHGYIAGWIVCLNGKNRGIDYRIYKGFNRMVYQRNEIYMTMEPKSDDYVTGAVVYDDASNRFFIMAQESTIKRNGKVVSGAEELCTGDQIEVESQNFEFVAFCREGKSWNAD